MVTHIDIFTHIYIEYLFIIPIAKLVLYRGRYPGHIGRITLPTQKFRLLHCPGLRCGRVVNSNLTTTMAMASDWTRQKSGSLPQLNPKGLNKINTLILTNHRPQAFQNLKKTFHPNCGSTSPKVWMKIIQTLPSCHDYFNRHDGKPTPSSANDTSISSSSWAAWSVSQMISINRK